VEYLRTIQHLRARTNLFSATFRVRSVAAYAVHEFFQSRGFVYVHTPIITGSDCEGAGEMFRVTTLDPENPPRTEDGKVDYPGLFRQGHEPHRLRPAQRRKLCHGLRRRLHLRPHLPRRELQHPRHAAEFWMIEPEMAFCDLDGDMECMEDDGEIHHQHRAGKAARRRWIFQLSLWTRVCWSACSPVATSDFGRVTYTEAVDILIKSGHKFDYPVSWGIDLQTEHERYLTEEVFKRPVFVTDYPKEIKAFYMRQNDDGKTVAAADCLVPGIGEIIGGSQREERLDGCLGHAWQRAGYARGGLLVVPRPAPLRQLPPRGLRSGL
jgi:asparaginyl-tRNA synthetase